MTSDGTKTYVWDARDRLVQIKTGASVNASFAYDALGRRSTRTVGSATTKFLYDGLNPIQEQSASNAATANLLTGLGVDGFISRTTVSDGLTVHFLPDALNSTLALTDSSGVVSTSYTYEPFGKATKTGAATTNSFGFTGREEDGTGLMYYRARYYNPSTQRFISEDPIGLLGGINSYGYVDQSPTQYTDPAGQLITLPLAFAGGTIAAGIEGWRQVGAWIFSGNEEEFDNKKLVTSFASGFVGGLTLNPAAGIALNGVGNAAAGVADRAWHGNANPANLGDIAGDLGVGILTGGIGAGFSSQITKLAPAIGGYPRITMVWPTGYVQPSISTFAWPLMTIGREGGMVISNLPGNYFANPLTQFWNFMMRSPNLSCR